jgi:hypothetical protein
MELIKGIGMPFPENFSSCSNLPPKEFCWTSKEGIADIYIDDKIIDGLQTPKNDSKFGWLCESREIAIDIFNTILQNPKKFKEKYAGIFTCDETLLGCDSLFIYAPPGSNLPWTKPEEISIYEKSKLCSMLCSPKARTEGHKLRLEVAKTLMNRLDLFGGAHGSPRIGEGFGPKQDWWRSKLPALKDYMFSIVFENAVYDKYYTEKITDCFATGTIPVYWGTKKVVEDFNSDGIIFYDELGSIEDLNEELYLSKSDSIKDNLERVRSLKSGDDCVYSAIKTIQNAEK